MAGKDRLLLELKTHLLSLMPLTEEAWHAFYTHIQYHQFEKNDYIFKVNIPEKNIHFLCEGLVRLFYLLENGNEFNKSFLKGHDLVASIDQGFHDQPANYNAQCMSRCYSISVSYQQLRLLAAEFDCWSQFIQRSVEHLALKKQRREQQLLTDTPTQRYESFMSEFGSVAADIPLFQIAAYLGITDVSLSRIRKRLNVS